MTSVTMKGKYGFCFMLLLFALPALYAQEQDSIRQKFHRHFHDKARPGLLFGYADGFNDFSEAFGMADTAKKLPLLPSQQMMSGSTGKIVVSAALLQLVSAKRIQLEDPVAKHLKGEWALLIPNYDCLRIIDLLRHRSGIPRYIFTDFREVVKADPDWKWTPVQRLRFVKNAKPLFDCDSAFAYSDTNYILLGAILEKVTGKNFYEYARQEIFEPLGLSSFLPTNGRSIAGLSNGYAGAKDPLGFNGPALDHEGRSRYNMQFEWTGGGYAYNPQDMARLILAIFEGKVFGEELLPFYTQFLPAPEVGAAYGLGIMEYHLDDKVLYGHSGFFPGYVAQVYYDPEQKCSYVFQINASTAEGVKALYQGIKSYFAAE